MSNGHVKVAAMRQKLSMAKEMLEELLAERDEMEKRHAEEIARRETRVTAGRSVVLNELP